MKKRILTLLLALALCSGLLSGCSNSGGPASGPASTSPSPAPSPAPAETAAPPSETVDDGAWQEILLSMPYCGDAAACQMTAEQALAYARLLADGIAGKAPRGEDYYGMFQSDVFFWDTPTTVLGYSGEYQTDRANVILGDFAGDGHPYLCVISSLTQEAGFDVYYSDGAAAKHVYGDEAYGGRRYTSFALDENGKMTISTGGPNGAASHDDMRYGVSGGEAVELYSYSEDYDWETDLMHITINGVENVYTLEEWEAQQDSNTDGWEDPPSASYTPIPLRSMIGYLNQYAAAKGSAESVTVTERPAASKMAAAMLDAMNRELTGTEYDEARLVDLDGDGLDELAVYDGNQAWLHYWKNGQLHTREIGFVVGGWVEWWLCKDASTGELGIEYRCNGGGSFIGGTSTFYYLSHEVSAGDHRDVDGDDNTTQFTVDGVQVTQAEHQKVLEQNQRVEELISETGPGAHLEETKAKLNSLL